VLIQAESARAVDADRTEITRSTSTDSCETPGDLRSSSGIFRFYRHTPKRGRQAAEYASHRPLLLCYDLDKAFFAAFFA